MARLTIEACWWTDPRRAALVRLVGDEDLADAGAMKAWVLAQQFWKHDRSLIPKALFETLRFASELVRVGLADVRESFVYVRGSSAYFDWIYEQIITGRENGKKGGLASAESRRKKYGTAQPKVNKPEAPPNPPPNPPSNESPNVRSESNPSYSCSSSISSSDSFSDSENISTDLPVNRSGRTSKTWEAYREAYRKRHGVDPVRNKTVNGVLAKFVERLGQEEAPLVAAFFIGHNDSFYVKAMHPVGLMLRDAEKLRTEWATGRKMTSAAARDTERLDTYQDQFRRIAEGSL